MAYLFLPFLGPLMLVLSAYLAIRQRGMRPQKAAVLAEALLQLLDLNRESGLRQVQPLRRARQVPIVRNGPEIAEVVIVERHIVLIK